MRLTAKILLLSSGLFACSHGTARMGRNVVGGHPVGGDLALNAEKSGSGDSVRYELFVHWTSNFRIDIKPGQSLTIIADREQMNFTAAKDDIRQDSNCEQGPCLYDERAYYPATGDQLRRISEAQVVSVEVTGNKRTITREFNYINFDNFRSFVSQNVPPASASR
jgi:hypothetical protein